MNNKLLTTLTLASLLFSGCVSNEATPSTMETTKKRGLFQTVALEKATMLQTGEAKYNCPECGMKLPMFYKTNHAAISNGKQKQYCSLHCMADDKMNNQSNLTNMKVVAVDTLEFIDVHDAIYVVGSEVKGTMSGVSKYAFKGRMSAERFAQEHQGKVMNFEEAYEYAKKDFN